MIILQPTTLAATTQSFSTIGQNTTSLVCSGLQNNESAKIQIYAEASSSWIDYIISGKVQGFNSQNVVIEIFDSCLTYRVVKSVTASAVGISASQDVNIIQGV